jgi:hypothetical protein
MRNMREAGMGNILARWSLTGTRLASGTAKAGVSRDNRVDTDPPDKKKAAPGFRWGDKAPSKVNSPVVRLKL